MKNRIENLEKSESSKLTSELTNEVIEMEWRSRRQNLEIHGIPMKENENLRTVVNEIVIKLGAQELISSDIAAMHRLP